MYYRRLCLALLMGLAVPLLAQAQPPTAPPSPDGESSPSDVRASDAAPPADDSLLGKVFDVIQPPQQTAPCAPAACQCPACQQKAAAKKQADFKKKVAGAYKPLFYDNDFSYINDPAYDDCFFG